MRVCSQCGRVASHEDVFCARCGAAFDESPDDERRALVSIVFADLVGSTALGERLEAEVLRAVQRRYFEGCATALQRHDGQVEKFIGDAAMAVFGLARTREDDALRACRGALDLVAGVAALSDELEHELGIRLHVRVGVQSGEVVTGDPARGQALATGDTVNTAARLEQAATPGEVLIGRMTRELAGRAVSAEAVMPVTAKGKAEPVEAYRLLRAFDDLKASDGALVGRSEELALLRDAFARVTENERAEAMLVVGDAGMGKSRLLGEFIGRLPPAAHSVTGHCLSYGDGVTFWPVREIVDELSGGRDDALGDVVGGPHEAELLLRAIGRRPGPVERDEVVRAVALLLAGAAATGPLVAVVEDLHWAEATLVALLEALPELLSDSPVLLVATTRPEGADGFEGASRVRLAPLTVEAAGALLAARGTERGRRDDLVRAAGGNPMYLEQLDAANEAPGSLPPTLRALLAARIDRVSSLDRQVLVAAAVAGREFWPEGIAALLTGEARAELPLRLASLERAELIATGRADARPDDGPRLSGVFGTAGRYAFRHALIHEAAYIRLPKARAAELHERFAGVLERERSGEYAPVVAWHLAQAAGLRQELRPRAAAALEEAGRQALERQDPEAAEKLLSRAVALRPTDDPQRARLDEELARTRAVRGRGAPKGELAIGDRVADYEILEVAGRGGMGIVYRARDTSLGRIVALKVIAPDFARDRGFRERFQRESRIAAQLEHPNVIPVYRAGDDEGRLYIAMRLVEGTDLARLISDRPLEPEECASLLTAVADALDAAHAHGLVHRDVKPANVLIAGEGDERRVYLTDFGLAVEGDAEGGLTRTGQWVGTLAYVAPEQIRGARVDARTDVYALGGVLHHCLTGQIPYPVRQELEALSAHLVEPPPRPAKVRPVLPAAFDRVVSRAMAKDPAERHSSAGDLARAATAAARGERLPRESRSVATGAAAPAAGSYVAARPPRRVPLAALWAAGGAVLAVVIAIVFLNGREDGAPPAPSTPANPAGVLTGRPIALRQSPDRLAVAAGYLWAQTTVGGLLARIDPKTRRADYFPAAVDIGGGEWPDVASDGPDLWTLHGGGSAGAVDRVDTKTAGALSHVPLPNARAIAVAESQVWAVTGDDGRSQAPQADPAVARSGQLVRIDAERGRRLGAPVAIGREPTDVALAENAVWVSDGRADRVLRVDPNTRRVVARIPVGDRPGVLAAAADAVWVANLDDRTLTRIDPRTNEPTGAPVSLGKEIDYIVRTRAALWVASGDSTVTRLNPADGRVVGAPISVPGSRLTLATDGADVWVASATEQRVVRITAGK